MIYLRDEQIPELARQIAMELRGQFGLPEPQESVPCSISPTRVNQIRELARTVAANPPVKRARKGGTA